MPNLSKLESLDRSNYCRWSQKLRIFFSQLEIDYILTVGQLAAVVAAVDTMVQPATVVGASVKSTATTLVVAVDPRTSTADVVNTENFEKRWSVVISSTI